jgi:ABC-2 type transport system permease protein
VRPLAIAALSLRRVLRDRTALFFLVVLPLLIITVVGATVGGEQRFRVGVLDEGSGPLGAELAEDLDRSAAIETSSYDDLGSLQGAVRRSELTAGVVLPAGLDATLRAGGTVEIAVVAQPASTAGLAARSAIDAVVVEHSARIGAARFAAEQAPTSFDDALASVEDVAAGIAPIAVRADLVDADTAFLPDGFSYSAPTMLVLFVFITSVASGAAIIQTRRLGVYDRMLAAPVRTAHIVAGELLSYLLVALCQSAIIVGIGAVLFGVDWGDPVGAAALVVAWALVGTGAGTLSGTLFRTPEQADSIAPTVGIALGMLGGCMWPLEIVPDVMQTIGHLTPHGWAVDGWIDLLSRAGGVGDIAVELAVLLGFAAVLTAIASVRLRSVLTA